MKIQEYIFTILKSQPQIIWSWGAKQFKSCVFHKMEGLQFTVNGFLFKGRVIVVLNEGADLFEIFTLIDAKVKNHIDGVYLDELIDRIDTLVETSNDQSDEYKTKAIGFLSQVLAEL